MLSGSINTKSTAHVCGLIIQQQLQLQLEMISHTTVKHVTVKVSFLQEFVQLKIILLVYIKTGKNILDI
jgi:hypothetical protein